MGFCFAVVSKRIIHHLVLVVKNFFRFFEKFFLTVLLLVYCAFLVFHYSDYFTEVKHQNTHFTLFSLVLCFAQFDPPCIVYFVHCVLWGWQYVCLVHCAQIRQYLLCIMTGAVFRVKKNIS